jgi:hypothetical protein
MGVQKWVMQKRKERKWIYLRLYMAGTAIALSIAPLCLDSLAWYSWLALCVHLKQEDSQEEKNDLLQRLPLYSSHDRLQILLL